MKEIENKASSNWLLYLAWLVSIAGTLGSLYFSEIRGFVPCDLCWYQRILMYPLIVILGIGTFLKDSAVKRYVLPIAIIGSLLSLYHYLHQKVPGLKVESCNYGVPCNMEYINIWGFITIPLLAMIAFMTIAILLSIKPLR
ncbi:disulfide oxidoreductase [Rossellomorea sp. NPDC071047]|uniref:disulfide oxidoreductase n=1 Tax=Rossellomorea sp. NPDC071047 TaxID=3390675 RepID=UPI003CFDA863